MKWLHRNNGLSLHAFASSDVGAVSACGERRISHPVLWSGKFKAGQFKCEKCCQITKEVKP